MRTFSALRPVSLSRPAAAAAFLGVALFAVTTVAQAPQPPQGPDGPPHQHPPAPAPTNLKVLPKDRTGEQVHEIMHKWEADLGAECTTCHAVDPTKKGPNGRPVINFADDSKKEKATARLMVHMVEDINKNYVSMVENSGAPVTCGTCHRGHVTPQAFVPPKEHDEHEHHEGTPPAGQPPLPH